MLRRLSRFDAVLDAARMLPAAGLNSPIQPSVRDIASPNPSAFWKFLAASAFGAPCCCFRCPPGKRFRSRSESSRAWSRTPALVSVRGGYRGVRVLRARDPGLFPPCRYARRGACAGGVAAPGAVWTGLRVAGAVTPVMVFFELGPEWIWGADVGGLVLRDLMVAAFITIALACIVLPFLTEFCLMAIPPRCPRLPLERDSDRRRPWPSGLRPRRATPGWRSGIARSAR